MNDLSMDLPVILKYFKKKYIWYDVGMEKESFGQYIWRMRIEKLKTTRDALAGELNISSSHLYNLEHEIRKPSRELVIAFAKILNEPSEKLFQLLVGNEKWIGSEQNQRSDPPVVNEEEPEYLAFLSVDPNLPQSERELMADIIRRRYAEAKRNAEELRKIPPGINRPARIIKPE